MIIHYTNYIFKIVKKAKLYKKKINFLIIINWFQIYEINCKKKILKWKLLIYLDSKID